MFSPSRLLTLRIRYTHPESRSKCRGFFLRNIFLKFFIGKTLDGMRMSEEYLESTDHLDYTCIQPAHLLHGPVTGLFSMLQLNCSYKC